MYHAFFVKFSGNYGIFIDIDESVKYCYCNDWPNARTEHYLHSSETHFEVSWHAKYSVV